MHSQKETSGGRTDMPGASFNLSGRKYKKGVVISRPTCPGKSTAKVEPGPAREPDFLKPIGLMCDLHSTSGKGKVVGPTKLPAAGVCNFYQGHGIHTKWNKPGIAKALPGSIHEPPWLCSAAYFLALLSTPAGNNSLTRAPLLPL